LLPGRATAVDAGALTGGHAARAIDILDRTSRGQRLLPLIGHLPRHPDREISSKAALFLGKRTDDPAWIEKQLIREDPRLRANAVEAFWGSRSETAVRLMEACTHDDNPRVVGNALIGLHLAGRPGVPERALAMSKSEKPAPRSAAAWVMGRLGNTSFIGALTALMRDPSPQVRSTAVRSLGEISRSEVKRIAAEKGDLDPKRCDDSEPAVHPDPAEPEAEALNLPVPGFAIRLDGSFSPRRRE
jgi:hypothetical protein